MCLIFNSQSTAKLTSRQNPSHQITAVSMRVVTDTRHLVFEEVGEENEVE